MKGVSYLCKFKICIQTCFKEDLRKSFLNYTYILHLLCLHPGFFFFFFSSQTKTCGISRSFLLIVLQTYDISLPSLFPFQRALPLLSPKPHNALQGKEPCSGSLCRLILSADLHISIKEMEAAGKGYRRCFTFANAAHLSNPLEFQHSFNRPNPTQDHILYN